MKLTDLNPSFIGAGGEGISDGNGRTIPKRHGVGVVFDCPCGCDAGVYIPFANPLDGGPPHEADRVKWQREGDTFDTLTLSPSIRRLDGCRWHGWVTNGEVRPA